MKYQARAGCLNQGRCTARTQVEAALQVARGVAYLHSLVPAVIHRDRNWDGPWLTTQLRQPLCYWYIWGKILLFLRSLPLYLPSQDLKCMNILVSRDWTYKIADLGAHAGCNPFSKTPL